MKPLTSCHTGKIAMDSDYTAFLQVPDEANPTNPTPHRSRVLDCRQTNGLTQFLNGRCIYIATQFSYDMNIICILASSSQTSGTDLVGYSPKLRQKIQSCIISVYTCTEVQYVGRKRT